VEYVEVLYPEYFCNPALKTHADKTYPIVNQELHLVCYQILPPEALGISVGVMDQFIMGGIVLEENNLLCVPSYKTGVVQVESSTWGEIKATYR
jgi:hypothetical protein